MELRVFPLNFQHAGALWLAHPHVPPLFSGHLFQSLSQNSKDATLLPTGLLILWRSQKPGWFLAFLGFSDLFLLLLFFVCFESLLYAWNKVSPCEIQMLGTFNEFCFDFLSLFNLKVQFSLAQESSYVFTASFLFALPSWHVHEVPLNCPLSLSLPPITSLPCLFQVLDLHF